MARLQCETSPRAITFIVFVHSTGSHLESPQVSVLARIAQVMSAADAVRSQRNSMTISFVLDPLLPCFDNCSKTFCVSLGWVAVQYQQRVKLLTYSQTYHCSAPGSRRALTSTERPQLMPVRRCARAERARDVLPREAISTLRPIPHNRKSAGVGDGPQEPQTFEGVKHFRLAIEGTAVAVVS